MCGLGGSGNLAGSMGVRSVRCFAFFSHDFTPSIATTRENASAWSYSSINAGQREPRCAASDTISTVGAMKRAADKLDAEQPTTRFAKDQLKAIVERIERLEEEKKSISDDIRDVYAEAKGNGFDAKALRTIVRLRKMDTDERREQEEILETYLHALGMLT